MREMLYGVLCTWVGMAECAALLAAVRFLEKRRKRGEDLRHDVGENGTGDSAEHSKKNGMNMVLLIDGLCIGLLSGFLVRLIACLV